jgi:hypothetical protein
MRTILNYIFLGGLMIFSEASETKKIVEKEIQFSWKFENHFLQIELESKSAGWFAVGFNESSDLKGTKLFMASIDRGKLNLSERQIIDIGIHKSLTELGLIEEKTIIDFSETKNRKYLKFKIPVKSKNQFSKDFQSGKVFHILLAYSLENDFSHHSIYRTSVKIVL